MSDARVWQRLTFNSGTRQRKSAAGAIPSAPAAETGPLESAEVETLGRVTPSADSSGAKGLTAQSPLEGTAPLTDGAAGVRVLSLSPRAASGLYSVHHRYHPQ